MKLRNFLANILEQEGAEILDAEVEFAFNEPDRMIDPDNHFDQIKKMEYFPKFYLNNEDKEGRFIITLIN